MTESLPHFISNLKFLYIHPKQELLKYFYMDLKQISLKMFKKAVLHTAADQKTSARLYF